MYKSQVQSFLVLLLSQFWIPDGKHHPFEENGSLIKTFEDIKPLSYKDLFSSFLINVHVDVL